MYQRSIDSYRPKCRDCGKPIVWMNTPGGRRMPCDDQAVPYWAKPGARGRVVTLSGEVVACDFEGPVGEQTGMGFPPHWGSCPGANKFKR